MEGQRLRDFLATKPSQCKVLVVGDIMLDKYYYGEVTRISGEAPVPVTRVHSSSEKLGGSANIAYSLAVLGCKVSIAGFVGKDSHCESLVEKFAHYGIDASGLIYTSRPTTTKVRIVSGNQQMFRLDFEANQAVELQDMARFEQYIGEKLSESLDCVIISDHANGACTDASCSWIIEKCHNHGVPVVVDLSAACWVNYRNADYVVANLKRINNALLQPIENEDAAVEKACHYLMRKFHIKNIIATRSQKGMVLVRENETVHIPTTAQELFDVLGATDAVTAVFGMALAGGLPPALGAYMANLAASRVVTRLGTYAVTREELESMLTQ